ncbi:TraB/GumN family protein [Sphaerotilus sp.]|uniref:TraB/GumN family protein n=1 Tax=Sphaerotilus sp. TaxID=2093942 RepID=UPI002ACE6EF5|nr:TraB/GumN family protein [Sphaerotilus sp.]MDZ7856404.1 TraB/GumN family protein [Sphaerotilus sp.]
MATAVARAGRRCIQWATRATRAIRVTWVTWLALVCLCHSPLASARTGDGDAQCPPAPIPFTDAERQAGEHAPQDRGLLWRIEKDGRSSHLYATIHLARREWAFPGPRVRAALAASDRAAFELDLLDPAVLERLQRAARSRPGAARLPPQEARQIAQAARQACVHGTLDGLRPELQVVTLVSLALRRGGLDPAWGIDGVLMQRAQALGVPTVSLETPELQMALLVHDTPGATLAAVRQGLAELDSATARAVAQRMVEGWAEGRLADLEDFASWCACQEHEADRIQHRATVDARNPAMADRIAALHARGHTVFAAVGALHMLGPEGLPQLMARRGFRVEAVPLVPLVPVPPRLPHERQ